MTAQLHKKVLSCLFETVTKALFFSSSSLSFLSFFHDKAVTFGPYSFTAKRKSEKAVIFFKRSIFHTHIKKKKKKSGLKSKKKKRRRYEMRLKAEREKVN